MHVTMICDLLSRTFPSTTFCNFLRISKIICLRNNSNPPHRRRRPIRIFLLAIIAVVTAHAATFSFKFAFLPYTFPKHESPIFGQL